ncbi:hypothetical protein CEXT_727231 [Caerostris extrusa]|uniref:Uncharacterized protein n=1 Tax=Caerostris extrusa TaxID=172846 RepID=A0AAV4PMM1_CAEEX|nr:hypothetical protein CEXT_727231 [Caerostris extrusa]
MPVHLLCHYKLLLELRFPASRGQHKSTCHLCLPTSNLTNSHLSPTERTSHLLLDHTVTRGFSGIAPAPTGGRYRPHWWKRPSDTFNSPSVFGTSPPFDYARRIRSTHKGKETFDANC